MKDSKKNLKMLLKLTLANMKMFIRDKGTLFWSLFFPVLIIGIFGMFNFENMGGREVSLVYDKKSKPYAEMITEFLEEQDYKITEADDLDDELNALENEDRTLVIEIYTSEALDDPTPVHINTYVGKENEATGQIVSTILQNIMTNVALDAQNINIPTNIEQHVVNTNDLDYIDFLVPGVIGMTIMQSGLFSVVGTIVVGREKGILKRLFATPLPKSVFLISNIITRTVVSLIQIALILLVSYIAFGLNIVGSLWLVVLFSIVGSLTFLALGFLISGIAKTSEAARAMIMPIQMIMMFTGGVYFDRSVLPKWLFDITKYHPLTYLADSLKDVMVHGYNLSDGVLRTAIIGLSACLVGLVVVAVKTFRWSKN